MSRDVIKRSEFVELYVVPDDGNGGPRTTTTAPPRIKDLVDRLERSEESARRRAQSAAEEAALQARTELVREFGAALEQVHAAANALSAAREREKEVCVDEIVRLATAIAGKIVRREIRTDPELLTALVRRCLRRIPFPAPVRVRLHPDDVARIQSARDALVDGDATAAIVFEEDRRVERGGCVVETPDFVVDGRPRVQLEAARDALRADA